MCFCVCAELSKNSPLMENDFPKTERVAFEEIYGQKRSEAFPHRSSNVFNMREKQKIKCKQGAAAGHTKIFADSFLGEIEDAVVQRARDGYVSLAQLADLNYKIEDVSLVYKILEQKGIVNVDYEVEEVSRPRRQIVGRVWSKAETLRLLEAIETYGDEWSRVGEAVGRSRSDCILRFLKMDFGLSKLISPNDEMAQVIFLASRVHPTVGSAAAKEFMNTYGGKPDWARIVGKAQEQIAIEQAKIKRLEKVILESEILKLRHKVLDYKQMAASIDKEKTEISQNVVENKKKIQELIEIIKDGQKF